jgi:hypothetical protein
MVFANLDEVVLHTLKIFLTLFALPLLYFFKFIDFIGWSRAMSYFIARTISRRHFYTGKGTEFAQVKMFYWAIYIIITILTIIKFFGYLS